MKELTRINYHGDDDYIGNDVGGLILKVDKDEWENDEEEGHDVYRAIGVTVHPTSKVPLTTYRKWKSNDSILIKELSSDEVAKLFLEATGEFENLKEWIKEVEE